MTIMAIMLTTVIAFVVGLIDDRKVLPGWFKPIALIAACNASNYFLDHGTHLNLVFGNAFIPSYTYRLIAIIPIVGNTINSIDVLNGVVTGFVIITTMTVLLV